MILFFFSCESNPYPEIGEGGSGGQIESRPRRLTTPPPKPIGIIIDNHYKLTEGINKKIEIPATVPSPGRPILKLVNLPAGASFDEDKKVFSWTPGYFDGNDPEDPTIRTRDYTVGIHVRSTDLEIEAEYYEMLLTVEDSPQKFSIKAQSYENVYEGETLSYFFEVESLDYPHGPFSVTAKNLPAGSKIKQVNETRFEINYSPDYHHVKLSESDECRSYRVNCKKYPVTISVYNPANHRTQKEVEFEVRDVRLEPKLVIPQTIEQGLDSSFQVSSYDLNGDIAPRMEITPRQMDYGEFSYEVLRNDSTKSSVINVKWTDIPPSYNGKTVEFDIESCVMNSRRSYGNCQTRAIKIKIVVKDRKPPVIERLSWPVGHIEYLNHNEVKTFNFNIKDGDNLALIKNVKIVPEEMNQYITWGHGQLRVKLNKSGLHQFSLIATSEYNLSSAESFVLEVFRADRSRTLYFTDSTRSDEVNFFKDVLKDVTLMNPVLQSLNQRNLAGRDTLILGTDILKDPNLKSDLALAIKKIPNIVVASPLIRNMPNKFIDELQQYHNVALLGRYKDLGFSEKVEDLHFIARDDFGTSKKEVKLRGESTSESDNPLIFSVGVDRIDCEDVLDLTNKKQDKRLKIGIICDRRYQKGRYAVLGTEFSDLKLSSADKDVGKQWLRKMLNTDLDGRKR